MPSPSRLRESISTSAVSATTSFAPLPDVQQFDLEKESGVWRDHASRAAAAVSQPRRNRQRPFAADFHAGHALVPPRDDLSAPEAKGERLVAIARAVELLPF